MFQVLYKDLNGTNQVYYATDETDKKQMTELLEKAGLLCAAFETEPKKWQVATVVFDLQLIQSAKKAIKDGKRIDGMFTFGDPREVAEVDTVVETQLYNKKFRNGYVVAKQKMTAEEIKQFKASIGYEHLSLITRRI